MFARSFGALKASLFVAASVIPIVQGHAWAAEDNFTIEEVIVTATKRETSAQETAIPLSVLSGDKLAATNTSSVSELDTQVPSLNFSNDNSDFKVTIRGVGSDNVNINSQQGVALHQDGVYMARPSSFGAALYDVQRVEVLRGPQGTLYGRNATGGAINVITNQPDYDLGAGGDVLYGNYERVRVRGFVNMPLVEDKLALRVTASREFHDGYQKNLFALGTEGDDADNLYIRGQLRWDLSENATITARASHYESRGVGPVRNRLSSPVDGVSPFSDPRLTYKDLREKSSLNQTSYAVEGNFDLGWADATVLVNYAKYDMSVLQDTDASAVAVPAPGGQNWVLGITQDTDQFSTEVRLSSSSDGPFNWLVGAFYFEDDAVSTGDINLRQTLIPPLFRLSSLSTVSTLELDTKSMAAFSEVSYVIADGLTATVGARYTKDKISGQFTEDQVSSGVPFCFIFFPPGATCIGDTDQAPKRDWSKFTWKAGLDWKIDEYHMIYGTVSTGFRSGGVNISQNDPANFYYKPESLTAFEIGSKNLFFNERFELNLSAFYYDYKDQQLSQIIDFAELVQNAKSRFYGAEAEFTIRPASRLEIDGHVAYLDGELKSFVSEDPGRPTGPDGIPANGDVFNLAGNTAANTPKFSAHLGMTYTMPLANDANIVLRLQTYAQTKIYLRPFNLDPFDKQKGYTKSDAILTYNSGAQWNLFAGVNNIENEDVVSGIEVTPSGRFLGNFKPPRTWFVGGGVKF